MKSIKKRVLTIVAMIMMMGFVTSVMAQEETYPQETTPQNMQTLPEDDQEHMRTQEEGVFPQEQNQLGEVEYNEEIEESELPATVTASLESQYSDYEVEKVYRGEDSSYKVKVKNGDEKKVVYFDSEGTFVKEKDKDDDKHKDKNKDW